ncbi:MAG: hypothetical protein JWN24_2875 [Phycisphaerales bacterium]|nr:hypothetical protein [Phycisphaerales bacterium]
MRLQSGLYLACGVCLFLSFSCTGQPEGLWLGAADKESILRPVFAEPIIQPQSRYELNPFWMNNPVQQAQSFSISGGFSSFSYAGSSGVTFSTSKAFGDYNSAGSIHWNNLVFCDKTSGACRLLLDHKAVICSAYLPAPSEVEQDKEKDKSQGTRRMLLGIAEHDTNGDHYINGQDAVLLYAADPDGKSLTRLTPEGTQVAGIVADGNDAIYVRVLRDSNADGRFTDEDEALILRVDLRHPTEGQPIPDEQIRRRAQAILEGK